MISPVPDIDHRCARSANPGSFRSAVGAADGSCLVAPPSVLALWPVCCGLCPGLRRSPSRSQSCPGPAFRFGRQGGFSSPRLSWRRRYSWPWWFLAGCLAELISNFLWFHSPLPAAFLIYVGNAPRAMLGAWLVNLTLGRPVRLETLREILAFVVLGAGIAPVISATVGSATLDWFGDAIANLRRGLASMVDWRRHGGADRCATRTRRVPELARRSAALARAMGGSRRPGADLSWRRRAFLERLPALRLHHHAAPSLGRGAF